jgi:hypothetical protein
MKDLMIPMRKLIDNQTAHCHVSMRLTKRPKKIKEREICVKELAERNALQRDSESDEIMEIIADGNEKNAAKDVSKHTSEQDAAEPSVDLEGTIQYQFSDSFFQQR